MEAGIYRVDDEDVSVLHFWMEFVDRDRKLLDELQLQTFPDAHTDFSSSSIESEIYAWLMEDFYHHQEFKEEKKELPVAGNDAVISSCDSCVLDFLQDPEELPEISQPDAKMYSESASNSLSEVQQQECVSSKAVVADKIRPSTKARRSKRRKRLNQALLRGPLSYFSLPAFKGCQVMRSEEAQSESDSDHEALDLDYSVPSKHKEETVSDLTKEEETEQTTQKKINGGHTLPENRVRVLKAWMEEHISDPYASREEKVRLAKLSGLKFDQVDNWLSNTRYRLKIKKKKEASGVRRNMAASKKRKRFYYV